MRKPDYNLNIIGSFGEQMCIMFLELEKILVKEKPDVFLVLGDTNSSLGAIVAKRLGIRVFHMEAGNRCHDPKSPEEVNRKIIDHVSDIHMPYTERSRQNLLAEGIPSQNIFVTGNPIKEVIDKVLVPYPEKGQQYLVTLHRQENVDNPERLAKICEAISSLDKPVLWPVHPRTRKQLKEVKAQLIEPLGFLEFVRQERAAYCVLTDSGTVQEECAIFGTPCVVLRDSTERPEAQESGSIIVSGIETEDILRGIKVATSLPSRQVPEEYMVSNVSDIVVKLVLSYWR